MPSATEITSVLSAVTALLAGLVGVVNLVRKIGKNLPDSGETYKARAETYAGYSVLFGFLAWLLAVLFLVLTHVVTTPGSLIALRAMQSVAGALAGLGVVCCVLNFYEPIRHEAAAAVRPWLSCAGLAISLGVAAALIIAGL